MVTIDQVRAAWRSSHKRRGEGATNAAIKAVWPAFNAEEHGPYDFPEHLLPKMIVALGGETGGSRAGSAMGQAEDDGGYREPPTLDEVAKKAWENWNKPLRKKVMPLPVPHPE